MRKIQILGAFIAVLAFSALAVASASAAPEWEQGGKKLEESKAATSHGTIVLIHEGGSLGKAKIRCTGLFVGTVGPGSTDKTTLAENLTGTEKDLIGGCESLEGFCFGAVIHPTELPWDTKLSEEGGKTIDTTLNGGYNVLCSFGVQVECKGNTPAEFTGNGANGAEFNFLGKAVPAQKCSDGGSGFVEGTKGVTLGFTVS